MVKVIVGDLLESKAQTLVNTVNTVGVMGKGIALEFKKRFPDMFDDYVARCRAGEVKLGEPYLYRRSTAPWIINFPTKDHWRSVSRISDIARGLKYLFQHYREWGVESLGVPPLGCGSGQLDWRVVGPTLYRWLKRFDIPVELYAPHGTPVDELQLTFLEREPQQQAAPQLAPGWVALVEILDRVTREPHHWPVGRVAFQKMAYFATLAGIPTRLDYKRASFGPYARELKQVTTRLVNNGVIQEQRAGSLFAVHPGPTFRDARRAYAQDLERWKEQIAKVADLFLRIRADQAEIAATVAFAAQTLQERLGRQPSELEVHEEVLQWKRRRRPPIGQADAALAIRALGMLSWLKLAPSKELPVDEEALVG
ncbi:MAG TPA: macro domain-containing protein [Gemmatimonadales bacterium]|nr:macro domain-containing protein [Gemmatimonadales bacterium]